MGAIEALLALGNDQTKSSHKFSHDALDKLLNYHLSAKYWLRNKLTTENFIKDGFYDIGSAGPNLDKITALPTLSALKMTPLNKRREIITINEVSDQKFGQLCQMALQVTPNLNPRQIIQHIANIVSNAMGGAIEPANLNEFTYKFKITELKMKSDTNVLPIGQITCGTFYHRALLFKAICDRIGLSPCQLVRGDYNRAWNIVDIRRQKNIGLIGSNKLSASREVPVAGLASAATATMIQPMNENSHHAEHSDFPEEVTIVDLMFSPGRLLEISSLEAAAYCYPS
ncbi:Armadillo repeat-containing protein 3 [Physocladia obscura]|uniref:Armadillo repeat-containing protein 3 n=1 Tax=Physocladia obscura TaxID=109957 RepID=A0AAD5SS20_9FUNG|nr:Armadillo repeat-containing protein 3 [Physocladia obscura]